MRQRDVKGAEREDRREKERHSYFALRHRRMNAVRMRKEAQVYSAEEQKMLAMLNFEEKVQKETKVLAGFRQMLASKLAAQPAPSSSAPPAGGAQNMNPASPVSGAESDKSK